MKHFYNNIWGWFDFENVYRDAVIKAPTDRPSLFVEIGAWLGKSTAFLAVEIINSKKPITLCVVDTWEGSPIEMSETKLVSPFDSFMREHGGRDSAYKTFLKNVTPVLSQLVIFKKSSIEASKVFGNETVDFVFIDGDHGFSAISDDLIHWIPKIKPEGILAGHDINYGSVEAAVNLYVKDYERLCGNYNTWRRICKK